MKRFIVWCLVVISLAALLLRFAGQWTQVIGVKQVSGISILSDPAGSTVFLNNQEVGKTPFDNKNLEAREYTIRIEKDKSFWEGKVKLNAGTMTVVNREIASDSASAAGEILTLEKGKGMSVISNPSESDVEVDGKSYGKTPVVVNITPGEHTVLVSHANYLKRSIRADLPKDFNLIISLDLALTEADLATISTPVIRQTPQVVVKQTPTGFLRVRDKPSLDGIEIAQVKPKDTLVFLEDQGNWERVRLPSGVEGYVSSLYVEKTNP